MRYRIAYIVLTLFLVGHNLPGASAQDSLRVAPSVSAPQGQIVTPLGKKLPKRKLRVADSIRLAQQRDSIAKAALANNGSAFNIGSDTAVTPMPTPVVASADPSVAILASSNNPFDILRASVVAAPDSNQTVVATSAPTASILDKQVYSKYFLFWVFFVTFIVGSLVIANSRSAISNAYASLVNDSVLRQIYREQTSWLQFSYLALYVLFWVNTGIFVFLILAQNGGILPQIGQFWTLIACIVGVSVLFFLKHTLLYILSLIFPIKKELQAYNFIIITSGILLGLVLLFLNLVIAYISAEYSSIATYIALGIVGIVYMVRSLRGLTIASPYLLGHHFIIYVCTIELAPMLILVKLCLSFQAS